MRFLILDNSQIITTILRKNLKHLGCSPENILSAQTPLEAFQTLRDSKPPVDVILLDIRLQKGEDGLDFLEKLRRTDTITKVIIVSAFVTAKLLKRAIVLGAKDFIKKPFSLNVLQEKLQKALNSTEF